MTTVFLQPSNHWPIRKCVSFREYARPTSAGCGGGREHISMAVIHANFAYLRRHTSAATRFCKRLNGWGHYAVRQQGRGPVTRLHPGRAGFRRTGSGHGKQRHSAGSLRPSRGWERSWEASWRRLRASPSRWHGAGGAGAPRLTSSLGAFPQCGRAWARRQCRRPGTRRSWPRPCLCRR